MSEEIRYYEGVGRRKRAVARVRLYPGQGEIVVNGKSAEEYFGRMQDQTAVVAPLKVTSNEGRFNLSVIVRGGGITGQAEAIRHGLARALLLYDPQAKAPLRDAGFLTRDPREKERKKPGLKRARKAPQYTKR
ncbi:MAG: 30S ribosomal protein S9 [Anaerolineae bacterium]|jgi:small subunit ribosomal protein S9|nr:30S ribosomal protein S9 [Anaerolineae bacterium]MDX9831704.1 30S ribosomal protein S9 [Anaerolineae bacterium]